jgi:hypothetical protein
LATCKADAKTRQALPKRAKADAVANDLPFQYPLALAIGYGTRSIGTKGANAESEKRAPCGAGGQLAEHRPIERALLAGQLRDDGSDRRWLRSVRWPQCRVLEFIGALVEVLSYAGDVSLLERQPRVEASALKTGELAASAIRLVFDAGQHRAFNLTEARSAEPVTAIVVERLELLGGFAQILRAGELLADRHRCHWSGPAHLEVRKQPLGEDGANFRHKGRNRRHANE